MGGWPQKLLAGLCLVCVDVGDGSVDDYDVDDKIDDVEDGLVVFCWNFTSWQHLRSYHDRYQLVTVHTHGDFTVLSHGETRPPVIRT